MAEKKRGPGRPPIGNYRVAATVPDPLRAAIEKRAAERQQNLSQVVREALTRGLGLELDDDQDDAA